MALILKRQVEKVISPMAECIHELDIDQNGIKIRSYLSYLDSDPYNQINDRGSILLIPGIGSSVNFFMRNFDYLINQGYRVIAVDLLGFGNSDKPDIDYSDYVLPHTIVDLIDSLNIDELTLFGTSLGATVAMGVYDMIPNKVKSLILNAPPGFDKGVLNSLKIISLPYVGKLLLKLNMNPYVAKLSIAQRSYWKSVFHNTDLVDDEMKSIYYETNKNTNSANAYASIIREFVSIRGITKDLRDRVVEVAQRINRPTLLIWGKNDKVIPFRQSTIAHEMIKGSELAIIDECAHMPYLEKPDEFNQTISNFLSR